MITKSDLTQIEKIVIQVVNPVVQDLNDIRKAVNPIEQDLNEIKKVVNPLAHDIKDVKKRVRKIEKTLDVAIKMFNEDDVKLQKRIKRIEGVLSI